MCAMDTENVVIRIDFSNPNARMWYEKICLQIRHPQYQGSIQLVSGPPPNREVITG